LSFIALSKLIRGGLPRSLTSKPDIFCDLLVFFLVLLTLLGFHTAVSDIIAVFVSQSNYLYIQTSPKIPQIFKFSPSQA